MNTRPIAAAALLCVVVGSLAMPRTASAGSAVQLVLSNDFCLIQPCGPHPPPPRVVAAGASFGIYVAALDAGQGGDASYSGTVHFASTDPFATLPSNYTFLPQDQGHRAFSAILRTPGEQTITVSDPGNGLIPGTLVITVLGPAATESVPTISGWAKILLFLTLASVGVWLAQLRS